ncbi:MAG: SIR2 family protein [Proteobacteria bacterium]|nr:SIR2 family protein [Pseudomonadota bacterium]
MVFALDSLSVELRDLDALHFIGARLAAAGVPFVVLDAAVMARGALHTGLWSKFLVECFRLKRSDLAPESLALARLLWRLGSTLLITSNYDNVLKWAAPEDADPILWCVSNPFGFAQFHRGEHDDPTVWHLHGHIDDPEGLVLTPDGYAKLYGPNIEEVQYEAALESLRSLLVSHTFLFVGFSLADAAVNAQLAWLEAVFKGQAGKHFALLHQDQIPLFEARGDLQNVEPIPFTDHGPPLLALVTAMAEIVEPAAKVPTRPPVAANGRASPKLIAVPHLDWPEELGIEMPDSLLLRPESAVVPFHAERRGLLQEVLDWAIVEPQRIALRLQAGPGGAGKTRLMLEACRELNEAHGWAAGFLQEGADLERDLQSLLAESGDCFIVIDYAETRSRDVASLARTALHASSRNKVRLALVARDGGDWWDRLADLAGGDKALEAILRDPATKTGPYRLREAPVPPPARPGVFREARNAFAARKKLPAPEGTPPDLNAEHFGEILFLHLAALAALRGHDAGDDRELIETALGHERAYWRRLLTQHGLGESYLAGLEQAVALLTLLGGTRSARDARAILARTPLLRSVPGIMRDQLFEILRRLYRRDGGIGGLEPDLLAERLVAMALSADDELLDIALAEGAAPEAARHALTLLTRLARRDPTERRWLERALERHLAGRVHESFAVAMGTGAPLPELLAEAIAKAPRPTRRAVINTLLPSLPKETANLTILATTVAQQRLLLIKEKGERKGRKAPVRLLNAYGELASRLQASGRFKEAAEARAEALRHAQRLAARDVHLRDVAPAGAGLRQQIGDQHYQDDKYSSEIHARSIGHPVPAEIVVSTSRSPPVTVSNVTVTPVTH